MVSILSIWWQVEESSLKPMEGVEEITKAVQLDKAKVESMKKLSKQSPGAANVLLMFSG